MKEKETHDLETFPEQLKILDLAVTAVVDTDISISLVLREQRSSNMHNMCGQ